MSVDFRKHNRVFLTDFDKRCLRPLTDSERNAKAGRLWFDWLPVHDLKTDNVFRIIAEAKRLERGQFQWPAISGGAVSNSVAHSPRS